MIGLTRTTDAANELWSTTEVKNHTRIDTSADDTLVDGYLQSARQLAEEWTGRAFVTQTWTMTLDTFPDSGCLIHVPLGRLQSITSIQYVDTNGDTQTLATSKYRVSTNSIRGRISEAYGESWPLTQGVTEAVTIVFVAGYGNAKTDVPMPIRQAVALITSLLYEHRGDEAFSIHEHDAICNLLAPYRLLDVGMEVTW